MNWGPWQAPTIRVWNAAIYQLKWMCWKVPTYIFHFRIPFKERKVLARGESLSSNKTRFQRLKVNSIKAISYRSSPSRSNKPNNKSSSRLIFLADFLAKTLLTHDPWRAPGSSIHTQVDMYVHGFPFPDWNGASLWAFIASLLAFLLFFLS